MKVGIITFHRAQNYGAVLQMFALQEFIRRRGHEVEFIDYRNKNIESRYKLLPLGILFERKNVFKSIQILKSKVLTIPIRKRKAARFKKFIDAFLTFSKESYYALDQIPKDYDLYITGSDQVWNSTITGGVDEAFFLNFPVKIGARKISYAASTEKYNYPFMVENAELFKKLLGNLDAISVRENDVAEIIRSFTTSEVQVVLDPTLLLESEDYDLIIEKPSDDNYVLVYHLGWNKELIDIAEAVAGEKGLKIIEIHAGVKPFLNSERHKQELSPSEFLGYVKNADFLITTSFHGTAFSVIFKKQFYVFDNGAAIRQFSLLSSLGIVDRLISNKNQIDWSNSINYDNLSSKLTRLKDLSATFLEENL